MYQYPTAEEIDEEISYLRGYRIVSPKWAHDAFSGEGARLNGGRWNSPGKALVYVGGSRSLAALEMLVHLTSPLSRKLAYCMIEVKIPQDMIATYPLSALPKNWKKSPVTKITQEIGDDWIDAGSNLAITIPSTLIQQETNLLINPRHPDIEKIVIGKPMEFSFDERF